LKRPLVEQPSHENRPLRLHKTEQAVLLASTSLRHCWSMIALSGTFKAHDSRASREQRVLRTTNVPLSAIML